MKRQASGAPLSERTREVGEVDQGHGFPSGFGKIAGMIAHFPDARDLNKRPLNTFKPLFSTLDPPDIQQLVGVYEAAITGPGWLRMGAGPSLALSGLGDWWGKEFTLQGGANLVLREEKFQRKFPFQITIADSAIDGKPAIACVTPQIAPSPGRISLRRYARSRRGAGWA